MSEIILNEIRKNGAMGDIYYKKGSTLSLSFENSEFKTVEEKEIQGSGLRIISKDSKEGYSFFTEESESVVEKTLALCNYAQKVNYTLPNKSSNINKSLPFLYNETVESFNVKEMITLGEETINSIKSEFPLYNYSCSMGVSSDFTKLSNTNGFINQYKESAFYISLSAFKATSEEIIEVGESFINRGIVKDFTALIQNITETLHYLTLPKQSVKNGLYPVVFSPNALRVLVNILLSSFNGKNIEQGVSSLPERIGQQVGSNLFSLYNDALHPQLFSTSLFDDEGVESQSIPLIKNGLCYDGIYDLKTASKIGKKSTGNAVRGTTSPVSLSFRNIIVEKGETPKAQMISSIQNGLYIDELIGGGMSNALAGELSANIGLGYKIENGEIKGQVKNAMLNANVWEMLSKISAVSKDVKIFSSCIMPFILFNDIQIVV